jgi:hypothetical protein
VGVLLNTTAPNFAIFASTISPATVAAGSSAASTVTVRPTFGFNGVVALSCSGLPSGASCRFNPSSIANSSGISSLTIATSSSTSAGTYSVRVKGTSGSVVNSATVSLVIRGPADFALGPTSGESTSQTITGGQSAEFDLMVTPSGGWTGTVNLSCSIFAGCHSRADLQFIHVTRSAQRQRESDRQRNRGNEGAGGRRQRVSG